MTKYQCLSHCTAKPLPYLQWLGFCPFPNLSSFSSRRALESRSLYTREDMCVKWELRDMSVRIKRALTEWSLAEAVLGNRYCKKQDYRFSRPLQDNWKRQWHSKGLQLGGFKSPLKTIFLMVHLGQGKEKGTLLIIVTLP